MSSIRFARGPLARAGGKAGALVGGAVLSVGLLSSAAWASGAQTMTQHAHGADAAGLVELDFNPNSPNTPPGISLPGGCWLTPNEGIVSTGGNAVMHSTFNKTGAWFTTTYTGDAAVYPLVLVGGLPVQDPNTGNDLVDTSGVPSATGHLTTWFGDENNNQNGVEHATVTFQGTDSSGNAVSLSGHFQLATNANGQPTATVGSVTC